MVIFLFLIFNQADIVVQSREPHRSIENTNSVYRCPNSTIEFNNIGSGNIQIRHQSVGGKEIEIGEKEKLEEFISTPKAVYKIEVSCSRNNGEVEDIRISSGVTTYGTKTGNFSLITVTLNNRVLVNFRSYTISSEEFWYR